MSWSVMSIKLFFFYCLHFGIFGACSISWCFGVHSQGSKPTRFLRCPSLGAHAILPHVEKEFAYLLTMEDLKRASMQTPRRCNIFCSNFMCFIVFCRMAVPCNLWGRIQPGNYVFLTAPQGWNGGLVQYHTG